jgi:hypothetical protein
VRVYGGRDLEPSRMLRQQKFDLSLDSISAFRFLLQSLPSMVPVNGRFQNTKAYRPLVPQNKLTMVTYCRSSFLLSSQRRPILQFPRRNSIVINACKTDNEQVTIGNTPSLRSTCASDLSPVPAHINYQSTSYSSGTSCCFIHRSGV